MTAHTVLRNRLQIRSVVPRSRVNYLPSADHRWGQAEWRIEREIARRIVVVFSPLAKEVHRNREREPNLWNV